MQRASNTPTTSTLCVSLHRPCAPRTRSSQMYFTLAPGNHGPWVQQRKTRARPRATASPPSSAPVFEIFTWSCFAPLRKTERDAVIIGDSIVRATLAEGKVHTPWCSCSRYFCADTRDPEGRREWCSCCDATGINDTKMRQTETLKRDFRSLIEVVRSTSPLLWSSCQDRFPRIDEETKCSVDCLL